MLRTSYGSSGGRRPRRPGAVCLTPRSSSSSSATAGWTSPASCPRTWRRPRRAPELSSRGTSSARRRRSPATTWPRSGGTRRRCWPPGAGGSGAAAFGNAAAGRPAVDRVYSPARAVAGWAGDRCGTPRPLATRVRDGAAPQPAGRRRRDEGYHAEPTGVYTQ
ncbi:hypothetical protein HBB16_21225 [Pseudonocardia sp. MCCB 268]|nr:hypothetical protein [Pseudonocardia cytotoxica]